MRNALGFFWLQMPYMGYLIASAYDYPVLLFDPQSISCLSFFTYRTNPNKQDPILLAFIKNDHFVSLKPKNATFPFPEVFGRSRNTAMLETLKIPGWIKEYQYQLASSD